MNLEKKNYYEVLEISPSASLQEIHNAYQRAKNAYSGESVALYSLMTADDCDAIVQQIEEAYSILGIPDKRREYDNVRGFNQENTRTGFSEHINNTPDYAPRNSLQTLLNQENSESKSHHNYGNNDEDFQFNQSMSSKNEVTISKVAAFKKFGLNYNLDSDFEQEIENCTEYTGDFLKKIREYKGVTVERMSDMTKISKTYIKNIEADNFLNLPADAYTRGFVYQYAKCLKLNPDLVATSYLHNLRLLKSAK